MQVIYEACYATSDLVLLMPQLDDDKQSRKIESTSVWNQLEAGTGFGKDHPREDVPSSTVRVPGTTDCSLDCCLLSADLDGLSNRDFKLSQSLADMVLARASAFAKASLFAPLLSLAPTSAPVTLPVKEIGFDSNCNEKSPPDAPEKLSLKDMTPDNLHKTELKDLKPFDNRDENDTISNCYKGIEFINQTFLNSKRLNKNFTFQHLFLTQ